MNYQIILDPAHDNGDLTRLFGATKDIAVFTANRLVDDHTAGLSGATMMAQGGDTSTGSSGSDSSGSGSSGYSGCQVRCTPGHPCPSGAVPHDPYLMIFGAGAGLGLLVGLIIGLMVGKYSKQAR